MVRHRGGLLASTGAAALGFARFAAFGRVPDGDDQGGGGGAGGAAEEEDFFADAGGGGGGGDDDAAAAAAAAAAAGGGGDDDKGGALEIAEWAKSFSAEKKDGELSNQEWLAKTGIKDLDNLAQIARDNQKALRESGRVKVPGENATEAELKAYREATGAPLEAAGYEVELPEGAKDFELDTAMIDAFKPIAHKYHIPAAAFKELGAALLTAQLEGFQTEIANHGVEKNATLGKWAKEPGGAEQGKAEFKRGQVFLDLKVGDIQRMQIGLGVEKTMNLIRNIGQRAGEDFFAGGGGGGSAQFGYSDLASAQAALDAMTGDADTAKKIRAKDPVTVARYNRTIEAVAHYKSKAAGK